MMKEERQRLILEELKANKKINFIQLSTLLNVSYDSIRRDVIELEDKGFLKKVHGGAVENSYLNVLSQQKSHIKGDDLKKILDKTRSFFKKKDQLILMDGGTTNFFIAEQLPKDTYATIVTNSPPLALTLNDHPHINVILLGGSYYKHYQITLGMDVINQVKNINADLFFMGVNGIHPERGLSIRNYEESIIKQTMIQSSKRTICCVIEEKLDLIEPYKVADIKAIDTLVTNLKSQHELLASYKSEGLNIL
ncbi:MAG: DeoR/GlpR family transcriptional regulator of sugar metabolism [Spirosomataceae bacterium]|jgi:DeoR/GlpR family transcriptional regulator of sugar metabolism